MTLIQLINYARSIIATLLFLYIWVSIVEEHREEIDRIIKEIEGAE